MLQRSATPLRHPLQSNLKKANSLHSHQEPAQQAPSSNNILPLKALSPSNVNKPQANFNQISRKELPTLTSTMTARTPSSNCQMNFTVKNSQSFRPQRTGSQVLHRRGAMSSEDKAPRSAAQAASDGVPG
jgi:hypothetical protein